MRKVKYSKIFAESWKLMVKNLILFAPNIIMLFVAFVLFVGYLALSGILGLLIRNPEMIYNQVVLHEQIRSLVSNYPAWSILCLIAYIFVVLLTDIFFVTMKYGMIKDILMKRKASLYNGFRFAIKYYFRSAYVHILSFFMVFSPMMIIATVFYILANKTNSFPLMTPWIIIAIILLIVFVYMGYMMMRLLYVYPVMSFEEEGALKTIKQDFHYVKTHIGHTLITWILFSVMWFFFVVAKTPLGRVENKIENIFLVISITIVILILEGVASVWEHLFIFKSYIEGKDSKKEKVFKEDESWKQIYE